MIRRDAVVRSAVRRSFRSAMRRSKAGIVCACAAATVIALASQAALSGEIADACNQARERIRAAREELARTRKSIASSRAALKAEMAELEEKIRASEQAIEKLERRDAEAASEAEKLDSQIAETERELRRAFETVADNRKDIEAIASRVRPDREAFDAFDASIGRSANPDPLDAAGKLLAIYLQYFEDACRIRETSGEAMLPNGVVCRGKLLLCGAFGGSFVAEEGETRGLAIVPPGARGFHAVVGGMTRRERSALEEAAAGTGDIFPMVLDISGGAVTERQMRERSWKEWFEAGGPVMYPLALMAILAAMAVMERAFSLARMSADADKILARVLPLVRAGDMAGAAAAVEAEARRSPKPIHRVLKKGIACASSSAGDPEEAIEEAVMAEIPAMERFMGALAVFATVSPLLGLLGTITGMIRVFQILTVHGTGSGRLLSGGISEALITTEFGLEIAIPTLLAHVALNRRVRLIIADLESAANGLVAALREARAGRAAGGRGEPAR
jgi:biopolymer transport protein ExbB